MVICRKIRATGGKMMDSVHREVVDHGPKD